MLVGEKHTWLKPGSQEALFLVSAVLHDPEEITHLPVSVTCGGGTDGPRASLILTFCDSRWKVRGLGDQLYVGGGGGAESERKRVRRTESTVRAPGPGTPASAGSEERTGLCGWNGVWVGMPGGVSGGCISWGLGEVRRCLPPGYRLRMSFRTSS